MTKSYRSRAAALLCLLSLAFAGAALAASDPAVGRDGQPLGGLLGEGSGLEASADSDCFFTHEYTGCDDALCEATVCAIDSWCCGVNWDGLCVEEAEELCFIDDDWPEPPAGVEGLARILVYKDFADDNTQPVDVHISCNSGLPLEQDFTISEGEIVIFVLESFEDGVPDCVVTESVPDGYSAEYYDHEDNYSLDNCSFEDVPDGAGYACYIRNTPDAVDVTVNAVWVFEGEEHDIPELADASLYCDPVAFGENEWGWGIEGDTTFTASVYPAWDGGTECTVSYGAYSSAVEASGCESPLEVTVGGEGASCTITFTAFFEGIPAVNRYGLAMLALLMLGVAYVGFRRFV